MLGHNATYASGIKLAPLAEWIGEAFGSDSIVDANDPKVHAKLREAEKDTGIAHITLGQVNVAARHPRLGKSKQYQLVFMGGGTYLKKDLLEILIDPTGYAVRVRRFVDLENRRDAKLLGGIKEDWLTPEQVQKVVTAQALKDNVAAGMLEVANRALLAHYGVDPKLIFGDEPEAALTE